MKPNNKSNLCFFYFQEIYDQQKIAVLQKSEKNKLS